ncbi:unnamed protein product [Spirodela intermedia]|uniref:Endoglucanase n=1 Tax=Spirodela intermedia TaxID=51605 RepID=A0A7I8I9K0_SPIIN|nr:unnamed protein product [Spirodela intermedia]CAA6654335.1 unnamed protein product [Spirodela intermedia]
MALFLPSPVSLIFVLFLVGAVALPVHPRHHMAATHNYRDALTKSIIFFEGQRSGRLPPSQRLKWRRDSGLSDGSSMHAHLGQCRWTLSVDTTTRGQREVRVPHGVHHHHAGVERGRVRRGDEGGAAECREAIRWASDYLLKATAHPNTVYVQVGDANKDHACWERPEDMDTPRTVFKVDPSNPGSDVAAETAAALAAASLVFQKTDPAYSKLLRRRAISVFEFADKYRGPYSNGLKSAVCPFYCSYSGYQDELLWGAAWLHRATRDPAYLSYIQVNGQTLGADESDSIFGWDNKHVGARILLSKAFLVQNVKSLYEYKGHADTFICSLVPGTPFSQTQYTPGGLLFKMSDSNMQYVTSTSFLLLTYAKYLTYSGKVVSCGGATVDYILGDNPLKMSYMVGYGSRYPERIHHRGSSLPSVAAHPAKIPCSAGFSLMNSGTPNPNVLVGAVVGGPDAKDRFPDQRSDYEQSEPATYINAPSSEPSRTWLTPPASSETNSHSRSLRKDRASHLVGFFSLKCAGAPPPPCGRRTERHDGVWGGPPAAGTSF